MPNVLVSALLPVSTVAPLVITTTSPLPGGTTGTAYSTTIAATGGVPSYTWSLVSASPNTGAWVSINASTGVISGTPGTAETETIVVQVMDSVGNITTKTFSLMVALTNPLQITTTSPLPGATAGTAYSTTITATGGTAPYTWAINSATPDTGSWISINASTGVISGTPGTAETESIAVKVTDAAANIVVKTFSLTVAAASSSFGVAVNFTGANAGTFYNPATGHIWKLAGASFSAGEVPSRTVGLGQITPAQWKAAALKWGINCVRFYVNTYSWLGINNAVDPLGGTDSAAWYKSNGNGTYTCDTEGTYVSDMTNAINNAGAAGLIVVCTTMWDSPNNSSGTPQCPLGQSSGLSQDHGPAFLTSFATAMKNKPWVIIEIFNEPGVVGMTGNWYSQSGNYPDQLPTTDCTTTLVGGHVSSFQAQNNTQSGNPTITIPGNGNIMGMLQAITTIRATGATNVITGSTAGASQGIAVWLRMFTALANGTPSGGGSVAPPNWSSTTAYSPGALVTSGGTYFCCLAANTNQQPNPAVQQGTYWYLMTDGNPDPLQQFAVNWHCYSDHDNNNNMTTNLAVVDAILGAGYPILITETYGVTTNYTAGYPESTSGSPSAAGYTAFQDKNMGVLVFGWQNYGSSNGATLAAHILNTTPWDDAGQAGQAPSNNTFGQGGTS